MKSKMTVLLPDLTLEELRLCIALECLHDQNKLKTWGRVDVKNLSCLDDTKYRATMQSLSAKGMISAAIDNDNNLIEIWLEDVGNVKISREEKAPVNEDSSVEKNQLTMALEQMRSFFGQQTYNDQFDLARRIVCSGPAWKSHLESALLEGSRYNEGVPVHPRTVNVLWDLFQLAEKGVIRSQNDWRDAERAVNSPQGERPLSKPDYDKNKDFLTQLGFRVTSGELTIEQAKKIYNQHLEGQKCTK